MRTIRLLKACLAGIFIVFSNPNSHDEIAFQISARYLQQEKNDNIRATAIQQLKDCSAKKYQELLRTAMKDSYGLVRYRAMARLRPHTIETLLNALNDPDDMVMDSAIVDLIKMGEPARIVLEKATSSEKPLVRQAAIIALSRQCVTELKPIYLHALNDPDENVRHSAIAGANCFSDPEFISPLLKAANDPNPLLRIAALLALPRYSDKRIIDAALKALRDPNVFNPSGDSIQWAFSGIFSHAGPDIIIKLLKDANPAVRQIAILAINNYQKEQTDKRIYQELRFRLADLLSFYENGMSFHVDGTVYNEKIARILLDIAEKCNDDALISKIIKIKIDYIDPDISHLWLDILKNCKHPMVRRRAAEGLREIAYRNNKKLMKDLEKYFQDKDSIVRAQISFYRAKMGDRNVVPILKELTGHPEQSIRSTAYEFLGALWSPETIDFLAAKLTAHLETLSAQDVLKAIAALDLVPNEKRQTILKAALRPAMESSNPETALKGFLIAMRVGNAEANHLLVQLFDYKNPQFKMEVLDSVRYYLPDTICRIIMDATIPDKTRERILNQLADCSCRDESTLPLKIEDELYAIAKRNGASDKVKQSIVAILRPEKALKDAELCGMALKSEYPNNLSSQPILSALESGQTPLSCRIKIARNLRDTTDPEAIERIKLLTKDKDPVIRAAIAETLGEISSSLSIPELEKLLHDSDPNVRQAAHSAIAIIQTN